MFIKTLFSPFIRDLLPTVALYPNVQSTLPICSHMKGGCNVLKKLFRFRIHIMQHSVVSTQILVKIYRSWLKECDYHKIQQYSYQN